MVQGLRSVGESDPDTYGAGGLVSLEVGKTSYKHPGKKRIREDVIPQVIERQSLSLSSFDQKLQKFGGTLTSDGKDDVSKDHLINYVTVCPDGYRFEMTENVSGISRKSEWVAQDLVEHLAKVSCDLHQHLESYKETKEQDSSYDSEKHYLSFRDHKLLADFVKSLGT